MMEFLNGSSLGYNLSSMPEGDRTRQGMLAGKSRREQNVFLYSGLSSHQTAGIGDLISVIKYNLNIRFLEN